MLRQVKNDYHLFQAILANLAYKFPAKKLTIIGITGTDGKTTTATLLHHILLTAGVKSALITTIGAYIGNEYFDTGFHTTTPSSFALQKYIKIAKSLGCTHIIIEVTSHAIDQNRVWGIPFDIAVVTNITPEHLDYHKTYERYVTAKSKLLKRAKHAILNEDDLSFALLLKTLSKNRTYPYSLTDKAAYVTSHVLPQKMNIMGEFNMQNALAAAAAAKILLIPDESITMSISTFTPPEGRQEIIHDGEFKVMVDFAHTPNSFKMVLPEIKKGTPGRLIHIFGAASKRDTTKRPEMGKIAAEFDDLVILTSEDPRGENVSHINEQIKAGMGDQTPGKIIEITDRKRAIQYAINLALAGDTVLLTGKGHEKSMNIDGRGETPWSDKEAVQEALQKTSNE